MTVYSTIRRKRKKQILNALANIMGEYQTKNNHADHHWRTNVYRTTLNGWKMLAQDTRFKMAVAGKTYILHLQQSCFGGWARTVSSSHSLESEMEIQYVCRRQKFALRSWNSLATDIRGKRRILMGKLFDILVNYRLRFALCHWNRVATLSVQEAIAKKAQVRRSKAYQAASDRLTGVLDILARRVSLGELKSIPPKPGQFVVKTRETSETETPQNEAGQGTTENASDIDLNNTLCDPVVCGGAEVCCQSSEKVVSRDQLELVHQISVVVIPPIVEHHPIEKSLTETIDLPVVSTSVTHTPRGVLRLSDSRSPAVEYYSISDPDDTCILPAVNRRISDYYSTALESPRPNIEEVKRSTQDIIIKTQVFLSQRRCPWMPSQANHHHSASDKSLQEYKSSISRPSHTVIGDDGFFADFERKWALEEQKWRL
jgi:hypothetical protein